MLMLKKLSQPNQSDQDKEKPEVKDTKLEKDHYLLLVPKTLN